MAQRKLDINRLPSNNLEPVPLDPIVGGDSVSTRPRKGNFARTIRNMGNALFSEIVLPALKSMLLQFGNEGLHMMIEGKPSRTAQSNLGQPTPYYQNYQVRKVQSLRQGPPQRVQYVNDVYEDLFFVHKQEAEWVLGKMMERAATYGRATMGDLYDLCGLSHDRTAETWGWTELAGTRVIYTTEGYLINFPNPIYL